MPKPQAREFSEGALNALEAVWQRRVVGALATLLLDPERYEHASDGQHLRAHSQLVYGTSGSRRLHGPLGLRAADFYIQTVEAFIRDELPTFGRIFAVENNAVHITINIPGEFARMVRQAARDRRVSVNELIFTAVCRKVDEPSERAA